MIESYDFIDESLQSSGIPRAEAYDAVVIGGGFFGCCLALAMKPRFPRLLLVERESALLTRASFVNQARVHNGYHYPRSLITALRSAVNYPRFIADMEDCIDRSFSQIYAIARSGSRVSAYQFRRFCQNIEIPVAPAPSRVARLFDSNRIEEAFTTEECAFDAAALRRRLQHNLMDSGVEICCNAEVGALGESGNAQLRIALRNGISLFAGAVFNCTYSQINHLLRASGHTPLALKHEITEMAMIDPPEPLRKLGVTVMDGPFFSTMPFPALGLHSLSHVSYTPHRSWNDLDHPQQPPRDAASPSRSRFMLKDAARYLPCMADARYVRSLFETKTVLLKNETDDGRPILCRAHYGWRNHFAILGAKIDNIYDVLKALDSEFASTRAIHAPIQPQHHQFTA